MPVPCASTMPMLRASTPAAANACSVHRGLCYRWCGDVHAWRRCLAAVPADRGQNPVTVAQRVGKRLSNTNDAAFGGHEPVRRDVERMTIVRSETACPPPTPRQTSADPGSRRDHPPGKFPFTVDQAATG